MSRIPSSNDDYHIGWICALKEEVAASRAMLDEEYDEIEGQDKDDENSYILGRIGRHSVVIVALPAGRMGKVSATATAVHMVRTFKNLRGGLLVGIGGGLPQPGAINEPRLGDVVVSQPESTGGGVIQYDLVKEEQGDFHGEVHGRCFFARWPRLRKTGFISPPPEHDYLFKSLYTHLPGVSDCSVCAEASGDTQARIPRDRDPDEPPKIFYGTILSGDTVIKNATKRDYLRRNFEKEKAMCVEMEAAGLMNNFPSLVIRGICDYADSHKNDQWHNYAALTAAAYAKELLSYVSPSKTLSERPISEVLHSIERDISNLSRTVEQNQIESRKAQKKEEEKRKQDRLQECHAGLRTSLYESFKDINPVRTTGTCKWVLQHPNYNAWHAEPEHGLLWVSADPGCGKSVLAKSLVDQVLHHSDTQTACYFFFKDNNQQDKLCVALCAILHQLCSQQPDLRKYLWQPFDKYGTTLAHHADELWRMLLIASQDPKARPIICVFDGLDEATEESRTSLVGKLCEVYNNNNNGKWQPHPKLKVLVTSRPYESLRRDFEGLGSQLPVVYLQGERENKTIHCEIDIVIAHKVQDVAEQLNMSNSSRKRLKRALLSMENRTYLWLYLAIEDFRQTYVDLLDPESQDFDTLPQSVEEAYEKILARTSKKAWIYARRTFSIILGAQRPLRTGELRLALLMLQDDTRSLSRIKVRITKAKLETLVRQWCGLFGLFPRWQDPFDPSDCEGLSPEA